MIPLHDANPTRGVPVVTRLLLFANIVLWLYALNLSRTPGAMEAFYDRYSFDWTTFTGALAAGNASVATFVPLITHQFLHGGWLHVLGNMLYLWIFGDNVEDAIGHFRYVAFYLIGGVAAALTQMAVDPGSHIPMVGASGAISAVMAGYLMLYPTAPITVLNPIFLLWFFFGIFLELPAWVVTLEFFAVNLLAAETSRTGHAMGGVAFFAHIGGFVAGFVLVRFFMIGRTKMVADRWSGWRPPERRRADSWDDSRYYR